MKLITYCPLSSVHSVLIITRAQHKCQNVKVISYISFFFEHLNVELFCLINHKPYTAVVATQKTDFIMNH